MFESELGLAAVIGIWIAYELYGRILMEYSGYIRIVGGIAIIAYLYYQTPEQFQDSLEIAKQLMTAKDKDTKVKRNVSGLAKKKVAASQQWKCGNCGSTLDETYEVDHRIALFKGGSNEIENLVALCPHCHRKKTVEERLA
jgi:predicted restriction endonuclease